MFDLRDVRVMIAGGSSGIGLSTAKFLIDYKASVIITGRDARKLESATQLLGPGASSVAFDAANSEARAEALARIGKLDHLVITLSGGKGAGPFRTLSEADLRTGFEAKFWTHFSLARDAIPYLNPEGSITFVSAISAKAANPGTAGLAAINAAIEGLVKPLAVELQPLRVNAVAPGVVDTPWWDWLSEDQKKATLRNKADFFALIYDGKGFFLTDESPHTLVNVVFCVASKLETNLQGLFTSLVQHCLRGPAYALRNGNLVFGH